jgi:hypothetical protein
MQQHMQQQRQGQVQQHWVRRMEHLVLRVVSLGFSLASAHAIRWFFAPLDRADVLQPAITWVVAIGFGLLGYFVSRGLAHRFMNKERVRAYLPICLVVEVVEIVCNYALAAAVIQQASWLASVPTGQRTLLTGATYLVLSIIPLVSLLLAVVDMDLERKQNGAAPALPRLGAGNAVSGNQIPGRVPVARLPQNGANTGQGQGGFKFPFPRRDVTQGAQPKDTVADVRAMLHDPDKMLIQIP